MAYSKTSFACIVFKTPPATPSARTFPRKATRVFRASSSGIACRRTGIQTAARRRRSPRPGSSSPRPCWSPSDSWDRWRSRRGDERPPVCGWSNRRTLSARCRTAMHTHNGFSWKTGSFCGNRWLRFMYTCWFFGNLRPVGSLLRRKFWVHE